MKRGGILTYKPIHKMFTNGIEKLFLNISKCQKQNSKF